jgi:hypothetical protein
MRSCSGMKKGRQMLRITKMRETVVKRKRKKKKKMQLSSRKHP